MYKRKSLLLLVSLVGLTGLVESTCRPNAFTANATDKVTAKYKESTRRGVDYSKIEVEWLPFSMVEDHKCIKADELRLEFNNDGMDTQWEKSSEVVKPADHYGKYKWTIDAVPCKEYYFKLWVGGDGGPASLILDKPMEKIPFQKLIDNKGFEPSKPTDVEFQANSNDVTVNWSESCAQEIEIIYWPTRGEELNFTKRESAGEGNSVLKSGIEACSEYNYEVYAVIGEKASEPVEGRLLTAPKEDSTFSVAPEVANDLNSITVQWNARDQLPCVDKYNLMVCEVEGECLSPQILEVKNLPEMTFTTSSLKECTRYTLSLQPIYKDLKMKAYAIEAKTTNTEESVELMPILKGDGEHRITISWSPIHCAEEYIVYEKTGDSSWEVLEKSQETTVKFIENPCTHHFYGVAAVLNGKEGAMVEIKPLTSDNPVPVPRDSFTVEVSIQTNKNYVSFFWDSVECAEEYVIYRVEDEEVVMRTKDTGVEVEELACHKYHYGLKVLVDGQEYPMGEKEVTTQMDTSSDYQVENLLVSYTSGNTSADLSWDVPDCITGFEMEIVSQDGETFKVFNISALENKVSFSVDDLDMCNTSAPFQITARPLVSHVMVEINSFSEIFITNLESKCSSPVHQSAISEDNLYFVPIVIAVLVFVSVLLVLIVFLIRKSRNSRVYDAENGKILPTLGMYPNPRKWNDLNDLNRSDEAFEMDKMKN